jgi:oligopeptide/dipeptide ABC transporter ATP-binding protein
MGRLLTVTGLTTEFRTERGIVRAVNNVSYHVDEGEVLGIVGESGCGKSVSQLSLLQLIPTPPGRIIAGEAKLFDADILKYKKTGGEMSDVRGKNISIIFQEPMTSLNPSVTIAKQMMEMVRKHESATKKEALARSADMLAQVGIPDPEKRLYDYPHQLSGGMRQRVMIGIAMLCNPKMIIADEATTALDATIQAQILEVLYEIVQKHHTALVMVTHNLGIVARYANRVAVMYAGRIVETGTVMEIWENPLHPYTEGLIQCVPKLGERLLPIKGMPPSLVDRPPTCPFLARCRYRQPMCFERPVSDLTYVGNTHATACGVRLGEAGR